MEERIERIRRMEDILRRGEETAARLDEALTAYEALRGELRDLDAYYGGPDWRADLAADEAGELPAELRRGVLSEDGIYDLLTDLGALKARMRAASKDRIEGAERP